MMAQFPAMPFFFDAYWADTSHLTLEQHGAYRLLLDLMWRAPNQRIPNDDAWIASRMHVSAETMQCVVRPIIREFCLSDGNFITQERVIEEYQFVNKKHNRRSDAAKIRWCKQKASYNADAPYPTLPTPKKEEVPAADAAEFQFDIDQNKKNEVATEKAKPVNEEPRARLFREGKTILVALGVTPKQSGSVIGRWLKTTPDADGILAALTYAYENNVMEPIGYVTKLLNTGAKTNGRGTGRKTFEQLGKELLDDARRRECGEDFGAAPDARRGH